MSSFLNTSIRKIIICLFLPLLFIAVNSHGVTTFHFLTEMDLDESIEGRVVKYMHKDLVLYSSDHFEAYGDNIDDITVNKTRAGSYGLLIEFSSWYRLDHKRPPSRYQYLGLIIDSKIAHLYDFSYSPRENSLQIMGFENERLPISIFKETYPDPEYINLTDVVNYFSNVIPFPRFIYQNNEEYLGDSWELGVMLFTSGCDYGCGGVGYGPTIRYGRSNNIEKYFLGYSMFAGIGSLDGGGVIIDKPNSKKTLGAEVNLRFGIFMFTFTGAEGEFYFNTGLGI